MPTHSSNPRISPARWQRESVDSHFSLPTPPTPQLPAFRSSHQNLHRNAEERLHMPIPSASVSASATAHHSYSSAIPPSATTLRHRSSQRHPPPSPSPERTPSAKKHRGATTSPLRLPPKDPAPAPWNPSLQPRTVITRKASLRRTASRRPGKPRRFGFGLPPSRRRRQKSIRATFNSRKQLYATLDSLKSPNLARPATILQSVAPALVAAYSVRRRQFLIDRPRLRATLFNYTLGTTTGSVDLLSPAKEADIRHAENILRSGAHPGNSETSGNSTGKFGANCSKWTNSPANSEPVPGVSGAEREGTKAGNTQGDGASAPFDPSDIYASVFRPLTSDPYEENEELRKMWGRYLGMVVGRRVQLQLRLAEKLAEETAEEGEEAEEAERMSQFSDQTSMTSDTSGPFGRGNPRRESPQNREEESGRFAAEPSRSFERKSGNSGASTSHSGAAHQNAAIWSVSSASWSPENPQLIPRSSKMPMAAPQMTQSHQMSHNSRESAAVSPRRKNGASPISAVSLNRPLPPLPTQSQSQAADSANKSSGRSSRQIRGTSVSSGSSGVSDGSIRRGRVNRKREHRRSLSPRSTQNLNRSRSPQSVVSGGVPGNTRESHRRKPTENSTEIPKNRNVSLQKSPAWSEASCASSFYEPVLQTETVADGGFRFGPAVNREIVV